MSYHLFMPSKLYRHYKNKPYTYLGVAKHSETLEDLVLYETRYENPNGRLWVRPKGMFFENVEIQGKPKARFEHLPFRMQEFTSVQDEQIQILGPMIEKIFGEWDPQWFNGTLRNRVNFHLIIAWIENTPVGFKMGYELDPLEFYSWLGGILPEYRGLGLAQELMKAQHKWCESNGYRKISTKTQNRFREMLVLNIKSGFEVIGTHRSDVDGLKIVLEKRLQK